MAYVAITKQLVQDVQTVLARLENAEKKHLADVDKARTAVLDDPAFNDYVLDLLWAGSDLTDLRERLSPYNKSGLIFLRFRYPLPPNEHSMEHCWQLRGLKFPAHLADDSSYGWRTDLDLPYSVATSGQFATLETWRQTYDAWEECASRWCKVDAQITTFLERCKSLNEAIKLWPDIRRYIPDKYLEKVDSKPGKTDKTAKANGPTAVDALKAIDVDLVNASTVLARLNGESL